jgi:uncharacterized protein (TIGR02246 family)
MRHVVAWALLTVTTPALAAEATIIRPDSIIAQEWPFYVLIGDRAVTDVRSGERTRIDVPAGTRSVVIQCPKALGPYAESRIDHDFQAQPIAFFVITPNPNCVTIESLDEKSARPYLNRTKLRPTGRIVEYDRPPQVIGPTVTAPSATAATASPPRALSPEASAAVSAATQAWVDAFNARDAARLAALYDTDAVLSDATDPQPRTGSAAIADYYRNLTTRPTQRIALGEHSVRLLGDTAIDSGTYNVFEVRDGNATVTPIRYSFVYRQRGGRWLIVDHQSAPAAR